MEFAARLEKIKRLAKEQGGLIQEKQVRDAFADMHFEEDQMKLVFDYLAGQNIGIGEPLNPEDYLSQEEINYLDSYLESLTGLDELSSGEKEAVTLSAMAGDVDARRRLTEIFLPQVVDIAKLYAGQGALLEDLIGEGNVALAMAVEMLETAGNASEAEGLIGSMIMEAMENHISENVQQKETGQKIADKVNQVADQARELAESLGLGSIHRGHLGNVGPCYKRLAFPCQDNDLGFRISGSIGKSAIQLREKFGIERVQILRTMDRDNPDILFLFNQQILVFHVFSFSHAISERQAAISPLEPGRGAPLRQQSGQI